MRLNLEREYGTVTPSFRGRHKWANAQLYRRNWYTRRRKMAMAMAMTMAMAMAMTSWTEKRCPTQLQNTTFDNSSLESSYDD
jgi:cell division protein FtsX